MQATKGEKVQEGKKKCALLHLKARTLQFTKFPRNEADEQKHAANTPTTELQGTKRNIGIKQNSAFQIFLRGAEVLIWKTFLKYLRSNAPRWNSRNWTNEGETG